MNELMTVNSDTNFADKTPIEILLKVDDDNRVSSRNVFEFLGMNQKNYARWCQTNIEENEFAENGIDFIPSSFMKNGGLTTDYRLSISFAKKLCMLSRTERGDQARNYFIKVEKALKVVVSNLPQLTPSEMMLQIAKNAVQLEKRLDAIEHKVEESQEQLETAIKIFSTPRERTWQEDVNDAINALIEANNLSHPKFRALLYRELESYSSADLENRLSRLKNRLKKQGATYRERQAVTKLHVISRDKQLRAIFEGILRKYQAIYSVSYQQGKLSDLE